MKEAECLKQRMEQARYKLNKLENQYTLGHPAVLHQSMVLDELINEYNRSSDTRTTMKSFHNHNEPVNEELWPTHSLRLQFV